MPDIHFECPKCKQSLDAPEELANELIDCPTCKETIEVPIRTDPTKLDKLDVAAPPPAVLPVVPPSLPPARSARQGDEVFLGLSSSGGSVGLFGSNAQTGGLIRHYGLTDWWNQTFTPEEQQYIETVFQPLGSSGEELTHGSVSYTSQSAPAFLGNLAGWFSKDPDRHIAYRLLGKASELAGLGCSVLDLHFLDQQLIATCYRDREQQAYLDAAISACQHQIALAPQAAAAFRAEWGDVPLPSHKGYEQLAIIREKQGDFDAVIALCEQASRQEWCGEWERRIERVKKRKSKA